jgi:transposase-like protein
MSKGRTTAQAAKNIGVTEQTYYRWRKEQFLTSGKGRPPQLPTGPQLHPRYRSFESSGLSFTVTTHKKENHFQIVVEQR